MVNWKKKTAEEIKERVYSAVKANTDYVKENVLGLPASYLDDKVFNQDASFLKDAPYMYALVKNPNHIGCHTLGKSESYFKGTHELEKELIDICAIEILKSKAGEHDGYVASGGTEANLQAIWIYRNYYMSEYNAALDEIAIVCSEDSHYSMDKASNLLNIPIYKLSTDHSTRALNATNIKQTIADAKQNGVKYFIVIANMMTTMFGSVDDVNLLTDTLNDNCNYKLHIDGAYGGFYYPFTNDSGDMTFENTNITSFTLDAHKMAQSPYGTGIFLIRKGYMDYVNTLKANYVEGGDYTLIGSRSGANAIAVWMILMKNGKYGWFEKTLILQKRTEWLCQQLSKLDIAYYRNPSSNIVTIEAKYLTPDIVKRFGLVPDHHESPNWYKVVIMEHVIVEKLDLLVDELKSSLAKS